MLILDDQASIGGVWSAAKIYPSLFAQIKIGQFEYSFYPMRRENITDDGYIGASTIHDYLNDFARHFDLVRRTRLNTRVSKVERTADGQWQLEIESKPVGGSGDVPSQLRRIETARLIYATGATSHPVMPSWPQSPNFSAPTIHSSDIGLHLDELSKVGHATVVGAAKSAYDIVFLLLQKGIKVDWIIRENGSGPLAIMPPRIGLLNTLDVAATGLVGALSATIMCTSGPGYHFFHRTWVGRTIGTGFWRWLTAFAAGHAGYDKSPDAQKLKPVPVGNGYVQLPL